MEIVWLILIGFTAGTLGSMLGLGGGFLVVPALILLKGLDEKLASGTTAAVIVPTMLVTLWFRNSAGQIDWRLAALIALGAVSGAFLGSWLVRPDGPVDGASLRRLFAFVLLGLAGLLFFKK